MTFSLHETSTIEEVCCVRAGTTNLLEYANQNRDLGIFNDVNICIGNDSYQANRLVLSCFSPFFEKMFKVEMKEKYEKSVEIKCIDSDSMKSLIDFIYTGRIVISIENVCNLLSASDYLQINTVKQFCFNFIHKAISSDNCFTVVEISDVYHNNDLKDFAVRFITEQFDEVITSAPFKHFKKDKLVEFISIFDIKKVSMISLYKAIVGWTKHDAENRVKDLADVLQLVDFQALPSIYLEEIAYSEDIILNNHACAKMVVKALAYQSMRLRSEKTGSQILSLGGVYTMSDVLEVYGISKEPSKTYPDLPEPRLSGCAVLFNNDVYYIGGKASTDTHACGTTSVWRLNLSEEEPQWIKFHSMEHTWSVMGAAVFNASLVVIGFNGDQVSGEHFSSISGTWQSMPVLKQPRYGNALVSCENCLYAIGGAFDSGVVSSVECLLAGDGKWDYVKPMQTPRKWFTAVGCNGFIYAIGGQSGDDNETRLKSVEKYDCNRNEWKYTSDMNFKRVGFAACVLKGKIFVVGGIDAENSIVKDIECYDPSFDTWSITAKTEGDLLNHAIVVV